MYAQDVEVGNTRLDRSAQDSHMDITVQRVREVHPLLHFDVLTLS